MLLIKYAVEKEIKKIIIKTNRKERQKKKIEKKISNQGVNCEEKLRKGLKLVR